MQTGIKAHRQMADFPPALAFILLLCKKRCFQIHSLDKVSIVLCFVYFRALDYHLIWTELSCGERRPSLSHANEASCSAEVHLGAQGKSGGSVCKWSRCWYDAIDNPMQIPLERERERERGRERGKVNFHQKELADKTKWLQLCAEVAITVPLERAQGGLTLSYEKQTKQDDDELS